MNQTKDSLQVFLFDATPVRGEIVRIEKTWKTILQHQDYPLAVKKLLGELLAAGALLSATLKFNGSLIIQAQGQGPIKLLVVECNEQLEMRATAKLNPHIDFSQLTDTADLAELLNPDGKGHLVITLDPTDRKPGQNPYQGIVSLNDTHHQPVRSIAEAMTQYMLNSEQLETRIWLTANEHSCGGLLLQRLPNTGGHIKVDEISAHEGWARIQMLTETITNEELLTLDTSTIMKRLYLDESEQHGVRSFEARYPQFKCRCSRLKVADMLKMIGEVEVDTILAEQGQVTTACDFCGQEYVFDAVDCKQLFKLDNLKDGIQKPPHTKH